MDSNTSVFGNAANKITLEGQTKTLREWCRIKNLTFGTIKRRRRRGLSLEQAFTAPKEQKP
jgi:hypothetical protein